MSIRNVTSAVVAVAGIGFAFACAPENATDPGLGTRPPADSSAQAPIDTSSSATPIRGFIWSPEMGMQELPLPPYAASMAVTDVNNAGQVVGYVTMKANPEYLRAFRWSPADGYTELGSLIGPQGISLALAVNDSEMVTGLSIGPSGNLNGPMGIWLGDAFVWTPKSGMKRLEGIEGLDHIANINAAGTVAGHSKDGGFLWNATTGTQSLPLPAGTNCSEPVEINDNGQVLGYAGSNKGDGGYCPFESPFIWDVDGKQILIEKCDQSLECATRVVAINILGEVAGYTIRDGRPFRWTAAGGFSRMPINGATAEDINDSGDVVVDMETGATWLPFVWRASGEVAKIELLPGSKTAYATAINNKGQVVGTFY